MWWILAAVMVFGFFLRLFELDKQSLWLDEMTSIQVAKEPLSRIISGKFFDNYTPPLYYAVLHIWSGFFPLNEVSLRLMSAVLDGLNMILLFSLCRRLISPVNTVLVVSAYAVSPFMLYYAQEGRMYTLTVFTVLAYCLALERVVRGDGHLFTWAALSGGLLALGLFTHYYMAFLACGVMMIGLLTAFPSRTRMFAVVLSGALGGVLFAVWIPIVFQLMGGEGQTFRRFTYEVIPYAFFRFVVGYAIFPLNMGTKEHFGREVLAHWPYIVTVFGTILVLSSQAVATAWSHGRRFTGALLFVILLPMLIGLLISLKVPMLSERYLIVVLPFFFILLLGQHDIRRRSERLAVGVFFALLLLGDFAYFFNQSFGKAQWREAARFVSDVAAIDDVVLINPGYTADIFRYYFEGEQPVYALGTLGRTPGGDDDDLRHMLGGRRSFIVVSSGSPSNSGYAELFGTFARKAGSRVFPLETGIVCTIWQIQESSGIEPEEPLLNGSRPDGAARGPSPS